MSVRLVVEVEEVGKWPDVRDALVLRLMEVGLALEEKKALGEVVGVLGVRVVDARKPVEKPRKPAVAPASLAEDEFAHECLSLADECDGLPERCEAAGDWAYTLRGMAETAEGGLVTDRMRDALDGIAAGAARWQR